MHIEKDLWLIAARTVARKFIASNYSDEAPLFDTFWQAFSFKINEALRDGTAGQLTLKQTSQTITEISIAKGYALDLMTPVIIGTITEIMYEMRTRRLSANELEKLIGSAAAHQGAKPSLTACLIRHLPQLCSELSSCKENASEAVISKGPVSRYRIWTAGKTMIVNSIDEYEKNKAKYLFWIDVDEKPYISRIKPEQRIGPQAVKLLLYLIERLGAPIPKETVLRDLFNAKNRDIKDTDINNIEQQFTKLHQYCGGQFRKYLFANHKNGYGLKNFFADKYFIYERLR